MTRGFTTHHSGPTLSLRVAAILALGAYLVSLAAPAFTTNWSDDPERGWRAAVYSGQTCVDVLMNPLNLKGLILGGAATGDQVWMSMCLGGTSANLLVVIAIVSGLWRKRTATLICASVASAAAAACLTTMIWDGGFQLWIGCWLWIGSMLGLSAAAAWSLWRAEGRAVPIQCEQFSAARTS